MDTNRYYEDNIWAPSQQRNAASRQHHKWWNAFVSALDSNCPCHPMFLIANSISTIVVQKIELINTSAVAATVAVMNT
ncbi:hypothetical protein BLOT_007345 [Blomia tropicalis]|nr:hypothetical protein BLOT_007345 [Blomia tropicalis]